jgi:very-short-patch-repair endonuclease
MDDARTAFLMKKGIRVIRFWNNDVLNNLDDVIAEIDATLNELMKIEVEE